MARIIAICGKICSGKSVYARRLAETEPAVILSCDEVTSALFDNDLGEAHDGMSVRIQRYLLGKAEELVRAGCTAILDWGFWRAAERKALSARCRTLGIPCQWHYIDVSDADWRQNIAERNRRVARGEGGSDYYLDDGLMEKLLSLWEPPAPEEIDVWYTLRRS